MKNLLSIQLYLLGFIASTNLLQALVAFPSQELVLNLKSIIRCTNHYSSNRVYHGSGSDSGSKRRKLVLDLKNVIKSSHLYSSNGVYHESGSEIGSDTGSNTGRKRSNLEEIEYDLYCDSIDYKLMQMDFRPSSAPFFNMKVPGTKGTIKGARRKETVIEIDQLDTQTRQGMLRKENERAVRSASLFGGFLSVLITRDIWYAVSAYLVVNIIASQSNVLGTLLRIMGSKIGLSFREISKIFRFNFLRTVFNVFNDLGAGIISSSPGIISQNPGVPSKVKSGVVSKNPGVGSGVVSKNPGDGSEVVSKNPGVISNNREVLPSSEIVKRPSTRTYKYEEEDEDDKEFDDFDGKFDGKVVNPRPAESVRLENVTAKVAPKASTTTTIYSASDISDMTSSSSNSKSPNPNSINPILDSSPNPSTSTFTAKNGSRIPLGTLIKSAASNAERAAEIALGSFIFIHFSTYAYDKLTWVRS
jgi:hypothetical protein